MKGILFIFLFLMSLSSYAQFLRVIVPEKSTLEGYNPAQGELAFDSSNDKLYVGMGGRYKEIAPDMSMDPLFVYKVGSLVRINPGKIFLGGKVLENSDSISCEYDSLGEPSTNSLVNIYIVEDGITDHFKCFLGRSDLSQNGYIGYWKRIGKFIRDNYFNMEDGHTLHIGTLTTSLEATLPIGNLTTCTEVSFPNYQLTDYHRVLLNWGCTAPNTNNYNLYSDSGCLNVLQVQACIGPVALTNYNTTVRGINSAFKVYVKGTVAGTQKLRVLFHEIGFTEGFKYE